MKEGFTWHTPERDFTHLIGEKWWGFMFDRFHLLFKEEASSTALFHKINYDIQSEILNPQNYHLYDDACSILKKSIEYGYKNYILSNNYPELGETICKLGLSDYFTDYIISAKVGYDKPRKEIFAYALKKAGNPDTCFMIGDNPVADIQGTYAAGLKSILVHKKIACNVTFIFGTLSEIETVISVG